MTLNPAQDHPLASPTSDRLGGQYFLEQEIGRSHAASLYRAVEVESGQTIAIKVFQRRYGSDPRFVIRFRDYMKALLEISHGHLVSVLDYGVLDGRYYIATEWVEGVDLAAHLAEHGRLSAPEAIDIASQVCSALDAVHRCGLLHRNLKPQNILLNDTGFVKVSDTGLSGLLSESGLSRTHVIVGRFDYIAPEQVRGQAIGPESDLYSLGVILFEMLTNRLPFESRDAWEVLRMHIEVDPPSPDQLHPEIPAALAMTVLRSMQKDPSRRFKSAIEMNEALAFLKPRVSPGKTFPSTSRGLGGQADWLTKDGITNAFRRVNQFLVAPAPTRILGRQIPFGFLLFIQLVVSFALAFAFLYLVGAFSKAGPH